MGHNSCLSKPRLSADSRQHPRSVPGVLSGQGWLLLGEDITKSPDPGRRAALKITQSRPR